MWIQELEPELEPEPEGPPGYARAILESLAFKYRVILDALETLTGAPISYGNDVELLISVMLSAQTTDVNVNRVTERLFEKYRRPEDYLAVPQEELERDIYQTGFFRQKAKVAPRLLRVADEIRVLGTVAAIERELLRDGLVERYRADAENVEVLKIEGATALVSD